MNVVKHQYFFFLHKKKKKRKKKKGAEVSLKSNSISAMIDPVKLSHNKKNPTSLNHM
jgi:hypothetical protein